MVYMAWDDDFPWLKPVAWISSIGGGIFFVAAGFLGYETGRREIGMLRWQPEIDWVEVVIGPAAIAYGVFEFRRQRR
jgi:hypothetical protein